MPTKKYGKPQKMNTKNKTTRSSRTYTTKSRGKLVFLRQNYRNLIPLLFVILFAGVGVYLLLQSRANTITFEKGVVPDLTWGTSRTDMDRTINQLIDSRVRWVRAGASWKGLEPSAKGVYNTGYLADMDYAITKVQAAGIQVLMPIDSTPYWASGDPAKYKDAAGDHYNKYWRPTNNQDYADFTRMIVNRYKGMGVHHYEVWNEPNHPYFWPSGINAAEYLNMLKVAYPVIKEADPSAVVLMGGLSKGDYNYLEQLYSAGGAPYFDVANVHPYSGSVDPTLCWNQAGTTKKALDAFCSIEEVRNTMVANGDSTTNLWLTEIGWSTCSCSYGVTEAQQADYLGKAFAKLETYPYVKTAFWYNFRNDYWENNNPANWNSNTGLMRTDFSQKPAYSIYKAYGASSDTTPPTAPNNLTISSSTTQTNLSWTASSDNVGVSAYDVYRNNVKVTSVAINSYADTGLSPSTSYAYYIVARDAAGNSSSPSSTVTAQTTATNPQPNDLIAPVVDISSPLNGANVSRKTTIMATATDNVRITKMEIIIDGGIKTTSTSGSIQYSWNTRGIATGAHIVTVKAYDAAGNIVTRSITLYK